ncbi:MAG: helix-turn-helix domain-containing protein, partial [Candidatus Thorarchaeota archaeon]
LLEKDGLISSLGLSGHKRFFEKESAIYYEGIDLSEKDKRILSFLRQRIPFLVIRYLLIRRRARMNDLTSSLGLSNSTLFHHISRMVEEGVLIRTWSGAGNGYNLAESDRTKDLYLLYRRSYEDEVDEFTDIWVRL